MTNLKAVKEGFNKYCGPAVLSIVTGKNTDECAAAISKVNGNYKVQGVHIHDLKAAADKLGFNCIETPFVGRSLYSALTGLSRNDGIYIVWLSGNPGHYVCVEIQDRKIYFCDNHTKEPMPAASSARMMNGVVGIYKVEMKPKPELLKAKFEVIRMTQVSCSYCYRYQTDISEENSTYDLFDRIVHSSTCEYKIALDANK